MLIDDVANGLTKLVSRRGFFGKLARGGVFGSCAHIEDACASGDSHFLLYLV